MELKMKLWYPHLSSDLSTVPHNRSAPTNAVDRWWVLWQPAQGKLGFYLGRKLNYTYACTVKPRDILKVKNAFVKSAYRVTDCTICIIVMYYLDER